MQEPEAKPGSDVRGAGTCLETSAASPGIGSHLWMGLAAVELYFQLQANHSSHKVQKTRRIASLVLAHAFDWRVSGNYPPGAAAPPPLPRRLIRRVQWAPNFARETMLISFHEMRNTSFYNSPSQRHSVCCQPPWHPSVWDESSRSPSAMLCSGSQRAASRSTKRRHRCLVRLLAQRPSRPRLKKPIQQDLDSLMLCSTTWASLIVKCIISPPPCTSKIYMCAPPSHQLSCKHNRTQVQVGQS
jgi:hypothetical protein